MTGKRTSKPSRRSVLKGLAAGGAAAASTQFGLFNINHAWSQDVHWDGEPFDAGGATFILGEWGGFWEEFVRGAMLENFEKTYNCNVAYDSSWPWFPKYVAGGPQDPAFHMCNWNLPEMMKTARAGDYFLPIEDIKANVPNAADCWDFAFANGIGVTWAFGQYAYVYRTDLVDPAPADFKSFWEDRFAGNRATYITSNTLQMVFFITANVAWGEGPEDMDAGFDAMRRAMPMKISDFTGNMQTLVERGEVHLGVQWEGEVYLQMDKGISVAPGDLGGAQADPDPDQDHQPLFRADAEEACAGADERDARSRLSGEVRRHVLFAPDQRHGGGGGQPREQGRGQPGRRHGRSLDPRLELVSRQRGRHRRDHQRDLRRLIRTCRLPERGSACRTSSFRA